MFGRTLIDAPRQRPEAEGQKSGCVAPDANSQQLTFISGKIRGFKPGATAKYHLQGNY